MTRLTREFFESLDDVDLMAWWIYYNEDKLCDPEPQEIAKWIRQYRGMRKLEVAESLALAGMYQ